MRTPMAECQCKLCIIQCRRKPFSRATMWLRPWSLFNELIAWSSHYRYRFELMIYAISGPSVARDSTIRKFNKPNRYATAAHRSARAVRYSSYPRIPPNVLNFHLRFSTCARDMNVSVYCDPGFRSPSLPQVVVTVTASLWPQWPALFSFEAIKFCWMPVIHN